MNKIDVFSKRITTSDLTVRASNALIGEGINTVGDLVQYTPTRLRKTPNLGKMSYIEITTFLKGLGLTLGMSAITKEDTAASLEHKLFHLRSSLTNLQAAKYTDMCRHEMGIKEVKNAIQLHEGMIEDCKYEMKIKRTHPDGDIELRREIFQLKKELKAATANARQMYAANMRFNMATYKEIGEALGVSTNRARQIYMKQLSDLVKLKVIDEGKL